MVRNDLTLMILAGGNGIRMRTASLITPKPLSVVIDEPLIIRQIKQANQAGITNILVTTNPLSFDTIKKAITNHKLKVELLENKTHIHGSLPALNQALTKIGTNKVLLSFADIYFLDNPFNKFINLQKHAIGVSTAFDDKELSSGGIVFTNNKVVKKIIEKPIPKNKIGCRWNGLALFYINDRVELIKFLSINKPDTPEGDFFEYLRKDVEIDFYSVNCPDFINVNRPPHLLLASMYRITELSEQRTSHNNLVKRFVLEYRTKLLEDSNTI